MSEVDITEVVEIDIMTEEEIIIITMVEIVDQNQEVHREEAIIQETIEMMIIDVN